MTEGAQEGWREAPPSACGISPPRGERWKRSVLDSRRRLVAGLRGRMDSCAGMTEGAQE